MAEICQPLRHLFSPFFRPLFFLGDPPLLDLPVVGGGEVPWKPDQAVREVLPILRRHPPVVPEGAKLEDINWKEKRPAQMLGLTKEEFRQIFPGRSAAPRSAGGGRR